MPWQKRSSTRIAGAMNEKPGVEAVGSTPMRKVAMPITSRLATSVVLRPTRSPKWPKISEPSGLATKATPNTAKELSSWFAGVCVGKNSAGNTSEAAVA